jgi:two-component SAPR family response regulator
LAEAGISHILECVRGNYRVVTDKFDCDAYHVEKKLKNNKIKNRKDFQQLEQLVQKGYMEANGYDWAYPKAAELQALCRSFTNEMEI